jgi:hypothetical protein
MRQFLAPKSQPLARHLYHKIEVRRTKTIQKAKYWCIKCDCFVGWLTKKEYKGYQNLKGVI